MNKKKVIYLFLFGILMIGISSGIFRSIFNNYLKEIHSFTAIDRGMLEFPREVFGFLMVFVIGGFYFVRESRLIVLGALIAGLSYLGFALFSPNIFYLIFWVLMWSLGSHILVSLQTSLGLLIANSKNKGLFFGKMAAMGSVGFIIGTILVGFTFSYLNFRFSFLIACISTVITALIFSILPIYKHYDLHKRNKFIFKKSYIHYYVLSLLFGVRKQLFLVFAPWFIIEILNQSTNVIAIILLIAAVLGVYFKPLLGKLIDSLGERKILIYDGLVLVLISFGYVIVPHFLNGIILLCTVSLFFIIDEILFTLKSAREIYLSRIVESKKDLTPTIATGLSIEHVVSMTTPILAGIVWLNYGYQWVFAFCGTLAIFTTWYVFKYI